MFSPTELSWTESVFCLKIQENINHLKKKTYCGKKTAIKDLKVKYWGYINFIHLIGYSNWSASL